MTYTDLGCSSSGGVGGGGGSGTDEKVKVSANDTLAKYLEDAVVSANSLLTIATINDGSDEDLQFTVNQTSIDHDALTNFVANEHTDHTSVNLTAGEGLTGGGDISASRSFDLNFSDLSTTDTSVGPSDLVSIHDGSQKKITFANFEGSLNHDNLSGFVSDEHVAHSGVTFTAGSGLTGGGTIASSRTFNVGEGTGITVSADSISTNDSEIVHDNLSGFVSDEHVAHSGVTLTAGTGLSGGGTIAASRTFDLEFTELTATTADASDIIAIADADDSNNIKKITIQGILDLAPSGTDTFATIQINGVAVSTNAPTLDFDSSDFLLTESPTDDFDITVKDSGIDHDATTNFVADEHVAHSGVTLTAGSGLTGGGTIAASRTFNVGEGTGITVGADAISTNDSEIVHDNLSGFVSDEHVAHSGVTLTAGSGLSGGGTIAASRTFNVDIASATSTTVAALDEILIADVSNSDAIRKVTAQSIADLASGTDTFATFQIDGITQNTGAPTFDFASSDFTISETPTDSFDITINDSGINHDATTNFVADEHVAHSGVTLTAGEGLTGGGTIAASRTFNLDFSDLSTTDTAVGSLDLLSIHDGSQKKITFSNFQSSLNHDSLSGFVSNEHINHATVTFTAGSGLTGGGTIAASRTFNVGEGTGITVAADSISTNDSEIVHDDLSGFVSDEHVAHSGVTFTAGDGLSGGGTIAASRTFNVDIAGATSTTVASSDEILVADVSNADAIRKVTAQSIADLASTTDTFATVAINGVTVSTNAPTLDFSSSDFTIVESPTDDFDITINDSGINHDATTNFVADEHVAHSGVTLTAGAGLTGGGNISASRTFNVGEGTGITVSADAISTNDSEIVHDNLSGFVSDEHVAHSGVTFTAGSGLTGGGTIAASRTFNVGEGTGITVSADSISTNDSEIVHDNLSGFVSDEHINHASVTFSAGTGLTGGGDISSSRSFSLSHLGIESLVDPNADRILFWDDSAGSTGWLTPGTGLSISATSINVSGLTTTEFASANVSQWTNDSGYATASNNLSYFASTTSSQLAGVISDETGSGSLVFGTSPTISNPTLSSVVLSGYDTGAIPYLDGSLNLVTKKEHLKFDDVNDVLVVSGHTSNFSVQNVGTVAEFQNRVNGNGANDPVSITLTNTRSGGWTEGDKVHQIDFYSRDSSGSGAGVRARISSGVYGTSGAGQGLEFAVDTGSGGLLEVFRYDKDGRFQVANTSQTGQGKFNVFATSTDQRIMYGKLQSGATNPAVEFVGGSGSDLFVLGNTGRLYLKESLQLDAMTSTPTNAGTSADANIYIKGGKIIVQYDDDGTVRYKYLDLTGTGVTWVHSTTAP